MVGKGFKDDRLRTSQVTRTGMMLVFSQLELDVDPGEACRLLSLIVDPKRTGSIHHDDLIHQLLNPPSYASVWASHLPHFWPLRRKMAEEWRVNLPTLLSRKEFRPNDEKAHRYDKERKEWAQKRAALHSARKALALSAASESFARALATSSNARSDFFVKKAAVVLIQQRWRGRSASRVGLWRKRAAQERASLKNNAYA